MFKHAAGVVLGLVCGLGLGAALYARADQQGTPIPVQKPGIQTAKTFIKYEADTLDVLNQNTGEFAAHDHVDVIIPEASVYADTVQGNFHSELIFKGHPKIVLNGVTIYAETIHLFLPTHSYRLDGARTKK